MEQARYFIQLRRKLIYACHKAGVKLALGSDGPQVFNIPGFSLHHELEYMVQSGLTPYEALKTGTVNVAEYFKRPDAGTIKPGNVSDLVLLSANPLTDVRNSLKIEGVMIGSNWLSREYLDGQLLRLKKQ
jgi:imidazolonepropionase-like amidohydrolase